MSSLLRILLAAGVLSGLPFGCNRPVLARPGTATVVGLLSCDDAQAVSGDFDKNGVADRVALSNRWGRRAIHVVLNGRHQILPESAGACRLGVLDLDHDSDVDLVVFSAQGELKIWGNKDGAFRRLKPNPLSTPPALSSTLHPWVVAFDANSVPSRSVMFVEPPDPGQILTARRHHRPRERGLFQSVWRDPSLARPPPA